VALATNFPRELAFLQPDDFTWCLLLLSEEECFSKDHLTLAGILIAKMFYVKHAEDWIQMLLPDHMVLTPYKTIFNSPIALPNLSYISVLKGVLQVYGCEETVYHYSVKDAAGVEKSLREALFRKLCLICQESKDAVPRLLGFNALAAWFQSFSGSQDAAKFVTGETIQTALNFIFDEWDDPIDAIPHMVCTFISCLKFSKGFT
jgi:hypothetical protein